jgi:hypothetical protein
MSRFKLEQIQGAPASTLNSDQPRFYYTLSSMMNLVNLERGRLDST